MTLQMDKQYNENHQMTRNSLYWPKIINKSKFSNCSCNMPIKDYAPDNTIGSLWSYFITEKYCDLNCSGHI